MSELHGSKQIMSTMILYISVRYEFREFLPPPVPTKSLCGAETLYTSEMKSEKTEGSLCSEQICAEGVIPFFATNESPDT